MKQTLIIGSTVVDVILRIPRIPARGEDVNIIASDFRTGGCAWNVYKTLRRFDVPALLCSPVGTGMYGRMVREHLQREGIAPFVSLEEENGCCYCLVEEDGERSFLSRHGAEYRFDRRWMTDAAAADRLDFARTDSMFVCGIDVEDPTGDEIVEFAAEHSELRLFFAPGPRITHIPRARLERLLALAPFLHLNKTEARVVTGIEDIPGAARALAKITGNAVVITLGGEGCYFLAAAPEASPDLTAGFVPAPQVTVTDTVGAGDAHCGAVIAGLKLGKSLKEACETASQTAAAVVSGKP
jgi:sugar/nucleoside kinase (ribokinase family)